RAAGRRRAARGDRGSGVRGRAMTATAERERVELALEGMTCASCASRIERKLNKLDGVEATVNYATEQAAVTFDPARSSVADLVAAVEAAGYQAAAQAERATDGRDPLRRLRLDLLLALVLTVPVALLAMVGPLQFSGWEWV